MSCGKLPVGAHLRRGQPVQLELLRAGRVLHDRVHRERARRARCAGSVGTCTSVPAGQDPLNQCTDQAAAMCGTDGACNGSGVCRRYASGVTCVAASCPNTANVQPASTCNTAGTCVTPATMPCAPYICSAGACKTTCASNADCQGPTYVCAGTTCASATNLSVQLEGDPSDANTSQWIDAGLQDLQQRHDGRTVGGPHLRYWYTIRHDASRRKQALCDYAQTPPANCTNVTLTVRGPQSARRGPTRTSTFRSASRRRPETRTPDATRRVPGPVPQERLVSNYTHANDYSYNARRRSRRRPR